MKTIIYICILAALFFVPLERVNISNLLPIEALSIDVEDDNIVIETDTGDIGIGKSVLGAIENLKDNTSAIVYLDTVKYLIVSTDATAYVTDLAKQIRRGVEVYTGDVIGSVQDALAYLKAHRELPDSDGEWTLKEKS